MRTLVLNAGYEPLSVVSFRRALVLVLTGKATVLADSPVAVESSSGSFPRPSVIVLTRYIRPAYGRVPTVSRRGVLRRDDWRCAYCGRNATTIDHVIPRSRGGVNSWQNLVACCQGCNNRKGNATLRQLGWQLRVKPRIPRGPTWLVAGACAVEPHWMGYLDGSPGAVTL